MQMRQEYRCDVDGTLSEGRDTLAVSRGSTSDNSRSKINQVWRIVHNDGRRRPRTIRIGHRCAGPEHNDLRRAIRYGVHLSGLDTDNDQRFNMLC